VTSLKPKLVRIGAAGDLFDAEKALTDDELQNLKNDEKRCEQHKRCHGI